MALWTRWGVWFTRSAATHVVCAQALRKDSTDELPLEPERPWGCGWFDSSLDLREGLAVFEHDGVELGFAIQRMLTPERALH